MASEKFLCDFRKFVREREATSDTSAERLPEAPIVPIEPQQPTQSTETKVNPESAATPPNGGAPANGGGAAEVPDEPHKPSLHSKAPPPPLTLLREMIRLGWDA
jgi:hypothetical protein